MKAELLPESEAGPALPLASLLPPAFCSCPTGSTLAFLLFLGQARAHPTAVEHFHLLFSVPRKPPCPQALPHSIQSSSQMALPQRAFSDLPLLLLPTSSLLFFTAASPGELSYREGLVLTTENVPQGTEGTGSMPVEGTQGRGSPKLGCRAVKTGWNSAQWDEWL